MVPHRLPYTPRGASDLFTHGSNQRSGLKTLASLPHTPGFLHDKARTSVYNPLRRIADIHVVPRRRSVYHKSFGNEDFVVYLA